MVRVNSWILILLKIAIGAVVLLLFFRWFERAQIFIPSRSLVASPAELNRPFQDLRLTAEDGVRIQAWFFQADASAPHAGSAILLCHGNAGNLSHRLELFRLLLDVGVSVLAFDYRGYGLSEGRPSEKGTYLDAHTAYRWLREHGFAAERIIALGESLGGAVAAELAWREPLGGLVLQSTFTSIPDIGAELFPWLPVRWLGRIRYDTRSILPQIKVPVCIMHSRSDTLIPFHHAEVNLAQANEPKMLWELAGDHNDMRPELYRDGIRKFLRSLESQKALPK